MTQKSPPTHRIVGGDFFGHCENGRTNDLRTVRADHSGTGSDLSIFADGGSDSYGAGKECADAGHRKREKKSNIFRVTSMTS